MLWCDIVQHWVCRFGGWLLCRCMMLYVWLYVWFHSVLWYPLVNSLITLLNRMSCLFHLKVCPLHSRLAIVMDPLAQTAKSKRTYSLTYWLACLLPSFLTYSTLPWIKDMTGVKPAFLVVHPNTKSICWLFFFSILYSGPAICQFPDLSWAHESTDISYLWSNL